MKFTVPTVLATAAVVSAQPTNTYDFCDQATASTCGTTISGASFDLSGLCNENGAGWYGEVLTGGGQEFTTNVCGYLADECQISQYCQLPGQLGTTVTEALCLTDASAIKEGMSKQFGFSQSCDYGQDTAVNGPCSRCNMIANDPRTNPTTSPEGIPKYGKWEQIFDITGAMLPTTRGVQVTYPVATMTDVQQQHPEWGLCGYPQTGYQTMMVFECDCDQTSMANQDVLVGVYQGPWNTAMAGGGVVDNTNNCQFTYHFKSSQACPVGYCPDVVPTDPPHVPDNNLDADGSAKELTGSDKFLIVFFSLFLAYLFLACALTCCRRGKPGIPEEHFDACGWFFGKTMCVPEKQQSGHKYEHRESFVDASSRSTSYGGTKKEMSLDRSGSSAGSNPADKA